MHRGQPGEVTRRRAHHAQHRDRHPRTGRALDQQRLQGDVDLEVVESGRGRHGHHRRLDLRGTRAAAQHQLAHTQREVQRRTGLTLLGGRLAHPGVAVGGVAQGLDHRQRVGELLATPDPAPPEHRPSLHRTRRGPSPDTRWLAGGFGVGVVRHQDVVTPGRRAVGACVGHHCGTPACWRHQNVTTPAPSSASATSTWVARGPGLTPRTMLRVPRRRPEPPGPHHAISAAMSPPRASGPDGVGVGRTAVDRDDGHGRAEDRADPDEDREDGADHGGQGTHDEVPRTRDDGQRHVGTARSASVPAQHERGDRPVGSAGRPGPQERDGSGHHGEPRRQRDDCREQRQERAGAGRPADAGVRRTRPALPGSLPLRDLTLGLVPRDEVLDSGAGSGVHSRSAGSATGDIGRDRGALPVGGGTVRQHLGARRRGHEPLGRRLARGIPLQRLDDLVGVGALAGLGRQCGVQQGRQAGVDTGEVGLATAHPGEDDVHRSAPEGRGAARGVGEGGRPAPPVGGLGDWRTLDDLGREVAGGAHDQAGHGDADVVGHVGDAEVDEHRVAVEQQDVAGLEVAVDDIGVVDRVEGLGEPPPEAQQRVAADRPGGLDDVVERGTGHVAGHEVGAVALEVGVDHGGHPLVADAAEHLHLTGQPGAGVAVVGDVRAQQLQRHGPPARVEGEVDDPHAALAELLDQPVGPQALPLGRGLGGVGGRSEAAVVPLHGLRRHAPTVGDDPPVTR